jgi:hypothetical protein
MVRRIRLLLESKKKANGTQTRKRSDDKKPIVPALLLPVRAKLAKNIGHRLLADRPDSQSVDGVALIPRPEDHEIPAFLMPAGREMRERAERHGRGDLNQAGQTEIRD